MKNNQKIGYLFLLPIFILVCIFLLYPFLKGFSLSFFETKYGFGEMRFAGLKNYKTIFQDEHFFIALRNSMIWVVGVIVLNTIVPLFIAILLNREFLGKGIAMGLLLIPWLTPVVGAAMLSKWLLEPEIGVINGILHSLGMIGSINFLGSPDTALITTIIVNFWQFCPFGVLLSLAALSTISEELYEAMRVDGAGRWTILKMLIMPLTGKIVGFLGFLGFVWTFSNYSLIYMLTKGGPSFSTYTIPLMIYEKAFSEYNVGQSVTLASVVGFVLIGLGMIFFRFVYKSNED